MKTVTKRPRNEQPSQKKTNKWQWQRFTLLSLLGYEAAGCLIGGGLLIAAPDGRYMDMPVDIMNGAFSDFLIPGIILFGLGAVSALAFISVLRRTRLDWFMVTLSFGGLYIWFVVEIIILQELHWLHFMWGFPVFLGWLIAIPQFALRQQTKSIRKFLLTCGILSSLWYIAINIFVPMHYQDYNAASMTISELSAIGAPTRILWVLLSMLYPLLFGAFGWGIWQSQSGNGQLRISGILIIIFCVLNFYWPPMHQREIIAAGGGTLTDTLHIAWSIITLLLMMLIMGFGAASLGKRFRLYTITTCIVFIVFGLLIGIGSDGIMANLPTPNLGIWERINIGAFMIWVLVFAIALLRLESPLKALKKI